MCYICKCNLKHSNMAILPYQILTNEKNRKPNSQKYPLPARQLF